MIIPKIENSATKSKKTRNSPKTTLISLSSPTNESKQALRIIKAAETTALMETNSVKNLIVRLLIKPLKKVICYIVTYFILKIKKNLKFSVNFHIREENMKQDKELTYSELIEKLNEISSNHSIVEFSYIGESLLKKPIPLISIGDKNAEKSVLYVGTHHAMENIVTSVLIRFILDYAGAYERHGQICQINSHYLFKMRRIYIVPMLNPDGVDYRLNGISKDNPLADRVISYNGGTDFSTWQANARGVDLNHNYDAYFEEYKALERERDITAGKTKYSGEYPESEPEVSAICNFIRYHLDTLCGVLSLHTQGKEIYFSSRGEFSKKSYHVAKILSKLSKYELSEPTDTASYGGLTDWLITKHNLPSFTIECGKGKNPLPKEDLGEIYTDLRDLLFTFPILF